MANTWGVCLLALSVFCCTNLSSARQVPKECNKGPSYWCDSLRKAADCGAVGHCISTVWESQDVPIKSNEVSNKVIRLFRQLKDVKDLINAEYLGDRIRSGCRDLPYAGARQLCKDNTADMDQYMLHVLTSQATPETMCRVMALCNNEKLDNIVRLNSKKTPEDSKTHVNKPKLIGSEKCTWGPSYWCSNFR
ncbi:saposin a-type domain-containing protein [Phthorimaea operculella]|nr:saposin a-type domain-containing protein [Phthorimaea operculella]